MAKLILGNLLVFAVLFGVIELGVRWVAPDYANAYFNNDRTWGQPVYRHLRWGHRVAKSDVDAPYERTDTAEERILFLGDSVTFGYGVEFEDSYSQVAARLLAEAGCRARVDAVGRLHSNLPSLLAGGGQEFIVDVYQANWLIYQFHPNDVVTSLAPKKHDDELTAEERFEKFRISWLNRSAFLKWLQSFINRELSAANPTSLEDSLYYSPKSDPVAYERNWQFFERTVADTQKMLADHGIGFAILLSPEAHRVSSQEIDNDLGVDASTIKEWPNARVEGIAKALGIPTLDPLPALQNYRRDNPDRRLFFPNDSAHPTRVGHELIGAAAADFVRQLPGACTPASP